MITAKRHQLVVLAHKLRQKKYRDQHKLFLLEGERAVREGLRAGSLAHVFLREDAAGRWLNHTQSDQAYTVNIVTEEIFAGMALTQTPSGFLAIARQKNWELRQILSQARQMVYLDRIADPGNLGTIMRSCLALGVDALLLSPGSVEPYNDKVVRSSMGAVLHLPILTGVDAAALQSAAQSGFTLAAADPGATLCYYDYAFPSQMILLIGSEAFGLTPDLRAISPYLIKIPVDRRTESLNAAMSCAIILAEVRRQRLNP
jgi:TrmH family RNA methyltransferase